MGRPLFAIGDRRALLLSARLFLLSVLLLNACAAPPAKQLPPPVQSTPAWSYSAVVNSNNKMITLFDPVDLSHHEQDPPGWYQYDFAHANDLETGRFVAVVTDRNGRFDVRVTGGELNDEEVIAAGPKAIMRLRVINDRLLLSGGEAWPSEQVGSRDFALDRRWFGIENGDYRVIVTALDKRVARVHDYVFQLLPVENIKSVKYAPGLVQLIVGQPAGVIGVKARGFNFRPQCQKVPAKATWVSLSAKDFPIPGSVHSLRVPASLHKQFLNRAGPSGHLKVPLVFSRNTSSGTVGFYAEPDQWSKHQLYNANEAIIKSPVLCAVKIVDVVSATDDFKLSIRPMKQANEKLNPGTRRALVDQFALWARATNMPGWRFHHSMAERSRNDTSLLMGVLGSMRVNVTEAEGFLHHSNRQRAEILMDKMIQP